MGILKKIRDCNAQPRHNHDSYPRMFASDMWPKERTNIKTILIITDYNETKFTFEQPMRLKHALPA